MLLRRSACTYIQLTMPIHLKYVRKLLNLCDAELGGPGERSLYTVNDYIAPSKMTAETRLLNALNKVMTEKWNKELIWGDSRNDIQGFERNKLITINQTTFRTAGANSQHAVLPFAQ